MDNPEQSPLTAISIGPGIRGIERGVGRIVNFTEIALVEIEAFVIENLVSEMELGLLAPALIWSDAKTFPAELFRGKVDILFAGYPCQPFSNAGQRRGTDDPRHLYPYIERTVDIIRPAICFFENVRGHVTLGLREVIGSLEGLGYRVHWGIFSAEETGASHKRERVFIMAVRRDWVENATIDRRQRRIGSKKIERNSNGLSVKGASQLANPEIKCCQQSGSSWTRRSGFANNGELANTHDNGERTRPGDNEGTGDTIESPEQWQERDEIFRERSGAESGLIGELGNSNNSGPQGRNGEICGECTYQWTTRANVSFARGSVARPGQPQHEWECPRTTGYINRLPSSLRSMWSSGRKDFAKMLGEKIWEETDFRIKAHIIASLGMSANEWRLREDFLRALGNSVYPDSAELAFKTLMKKHGL